MNNNSWPLLGRLKRAVKKITFLLNANLTRWRVASILGGLSASRRRLSFNDRPGLRAAFLEDNDDEDVAVVSMPGSPSSCRTLSRTASCPSPDDDVDKRAEMFIANFYRQLRLERQVSLELRYCRGNSFGSSSPSPSPS